MRELLSLVAQLEERCRTSGTKGTLSGGAADFYKRLYEHHSIFVVVFFLGPFCAVGEGLSVIRMCT